MSDQSKRAYEDPRPERATSGTPTEPELHALRDPYAAFRFPAYRLYAIGNLASVIGRQMLSVVVGWEIYQRTHSATALGLVGLVQALPVILLAIPAGHAADRFQRKSILLVTQLLTCCASAGLALLSWKHELIPPTPLLRGADAVLTSLASFFERNSDAHFGPAIPLMFALLFLSGMARAFGWAARGSFMPNLVPKEVFTNAVTWNSSTLEVGTITGPALGGLLIAKFGYPLIYVIDAICAFTFFAMLLPIHVRQKIERKTEKGLQSLFSGMRFVWNTKIILATITLDLFAVLLGGATALLPMFADQILRCGPIGLGWMRAAPSIGAFTMGFAIAHLPPMQRAGKALLFAVTGFGCAMMIFGLSHWLWLSLLALALSGMCDTVSVVVRHTLVQLLTPDQMRGRVSAVNNIFIGSSNELGAFESGLAAALFGPVIAVVGGGIGTILSVCIVVMIWPQITQLGSFASMKPEV